MNKLRSLFILCGLLVLSNFSIAQTNSMLDTGLMQKKMAEAQLKMEGIKGIIMDSLQHIYITNKHYFDDATGTPDPGKLVIYIIKLSLPYHQETLNSWAESVFTKDEYAYYKTIKFETLQTTGIPVLADRHAIDYDKRWLYNFEINTTLLGKADFSYYEHLYHLTSYDITGNIMPPYLIKLISTNDIVQTVKNTIMNMAYDFFVYMHEFYHSYYEYEKGIKNGDEFAADQYAVEKWGVFTKDKDSKNFVTDDYLRQLSYVLKTDNDLQLKKRQAGCNTTSLIGKGVTNEDFTQAFLGERVMEMFLMDDSRFFITKPDQVALDIERGERFIKTAHQKLKCNINDTCFLCCNLSAHEADLIKLKRLVNNYKTQTKKDFRPEENYYTKLNPDNPGSVAMEIGDYFLTVAKDYDKALQYYESANHLKLFNKDEYTVLCNLFCYEIYNSVPSKKNAKLAKQYLQQAKSLNILIPTLRSDIIESLTVN